MLTNLSEGAYMTNAQWNAYGEDLVFAIREVVRRVWVVTIRRGSKETNILMFYGRSDMLAWDPARY
jgi:hypothetical protein